MLQLTQNMDDFYDVMYVTKDETFFVPLNRDFCILCCM